MSSITIVIEFPLACNDSRNARQQANRSAWSNTAVGQSQQTFQPRSDDRAIGGISDMLLQAGFQHRTGGGVIVGVGQP